MRPVCRLRAASAAVVPDGCTVLAARRSERGLRSGTKCLPPAFGTWALLCSEGEAWARTRALLLKGPSRAQRASSGGKRATQRACEHRAGAAPRLCTLTCANALYTERNKGHPAGVHHSCRTTCPPRSSTLTCYV
jgi:hypothetical protein